MNKLYTWYGSLPKTVQVAIAAGEAAAGSALWQWYSTGGLRFDKASLMQLGSLVAGAVILALHNLWKPKPAQQ